MYPAGFFWLLLPTGILQLWALFFAEPVMWSLIVSSFFLAGLHLFLL